MSITCHWRSAVVPGGYEAVTQQPARLHPRAFVAGATGYVGKALVARLRAEGVPTVAHVRADSSRIDEWRAAFSALGAQIDTTPWTDEAMQSTISRLEPTHVFAVVGTTRSRARHSADSMERARPYEAVDYGLSALLLRACLTSGIRPRYIYLSALGADPRSRNTYLRARGRMELELRNSGIPFLVFRPSFITGPDRTERRLMERLGAAATDFGVRVLGWLKLSRFGARLRSIDAATLADSMVSLALDGRTRDRVLERDELPGRGQVSAAAAVALNDTGSRNTRVRQSGKAGTGGSA